MIILDGWVISDIIIAIAVIVISALFLKTAPKENKYRAIKWWHIINSCILISLLLPVILGTQWPDFVHYIMIALILANNFAATLGSYTRLKQDQMIIQGIIEKHNQSESST